MPEFRYQGIAYRQSGGVDVPWLVTFVAASEELLSWAGIPRKSEHNLTGFQRPMDPNRVAKAKAFFDMPGNQSPTTLIVGIPEVIPGQEAAVELLLQNDDTASGIQSCELVVRIPDDESVAEAAERLKAQLQYRLGNQEASDRAEAAASGIDEDNGIGESGALGDGQGDFGTEASDEELEDEETDEDEDAGSDAELELGSSILSKLVARLSDPQWIAEQEEHIRDLAKPAIVIDGQHRVKGAEACERHIPFAVCAVMNAPWSEEVFQFTVVNYTAKGIPDQFITANAALSLTRGELEDLKERLTQAGVKIIEYELMQIVNFDTRSPFYDLVDLSDKRRSDRLGYKTMVQVARGWWDARHQVFSLILPNMYPHIHGAKKKTRRVNEWRAADWGDFFLAFWDEVHSSYKTEPAIDAHYTLWDVGHSQLVNTVVLLELQKAFLTNLNAQDPGYFEVPEGEEPKKYLLQQVAKRAKQFVSYFPPAFFATKWTDTSLNVGPGRRHLQEAFGSMVNAKGKYQYGKSALVAGKAD